MDENKFWLCLWLGFASLTTITITTTAFIVNSSNNRGYEAIGDMIRRGVDPIAAGCAIWGTGAGSSPGSAACVLVAQRSSASAVTQAER